MARDDVLSVIQAAQELGMHPASVRRAITEGRLRAEKLGPRTMVIRRRELERYKATPRHAGGRPRQSAPPPNPRAT